MAPAKAKEKTARSVALAAVARRLMSEAELRRRLVRGGYDALDIDDAVALIRSYRYVDDEALADAVVREAARTGRGSYWVRQTLLRRGVDVQIAARAQGAALQSEFVDATCAVSRRFHKEAVQTPSEKRRLARFLANRGFASETIAAVIGEEY